MRLVDDVVFSSVPGVVAGGGNGGFQLLQLVIQAGANPVYLLGFDMHARGDVHWHGRHAFPHAANPDAETFASWREAMASAAPHIAALGVDVFNATPGSALDCFPKVTL